jgi:nucleolar protein 56
MMPGNTIDTIIGPVETTPGSGLAAKKRDLYARFRDENLRLTKQQIRESVKKDLMIIQAVDSIREIDRAANLLSKRLREWYSYYCPEFPKSLDSNVKLAELILTKSRGELLAGLSIREDDSMGGTIDKADMDAVLALAEQVMGLHELRQKEERYIEMEMQRLCPNIHAVAGSLVGARLLSHAGSLHRLATMTSSTIQVLGAEKALFRHLKFRAKAPKHGVIMMHPLLQEAVNKGRAARAIADKIAIAAKVDYFRGDFIGDRLRLELERKLQ